MERKKTKLTISGAPKKILKNLTLLSKVKRKISHKIDIKHGLLQIVLSQGQGGFKKPLGIKPNFPPKIFLLLVTSKNVNLLNKEQQKDLKNDPEKDKKNKLGEKKERQNLLFQEL